MALLCHLKDLRAAGVRYVTLEPNLQEKKIQETGHSSLMEQGEFGQTVAEPGPAFTATSNAATTAAITSTPASEVPPAPQSHTSPDKALSLFQKGSKMSAQRTAPKMENANTPPLPFDPGVKMTLDALSDAVDGCLRCKLGPDRTRLVFGVGNPNADLVFVGEAPGRDEDEQGIPFVGRAGQMLTRMIENVIEIPRNEVYICNILKCRPPGNRNPEADEIECCEPYLFKQLEIIQPRLIVALGKFAAQWLLQTQTPIGKLRGKFGLYRDIPTLATYHPAYLLRNPSQKRTVMDDLLKIKAIHAGELEPTIEVYS
jgi:DNA polymerase